MKYKKFTISTYRSIDHAEVPVSNRLIPLIGVNESGKTSILKAILAFDKLSDVFGRGEHLEYKNRYVTADHDCTITADVLIDSASDLDKLSQSLNLPRGNDLLKQLESHHADHRPISITRNLQTKKYSVAGFDAKPQMLNRLANCIYEQLPLILYFDDFTDRVPESLTFRFNEALKPNFEIRNKKLQQWQMILEEIFLRATGRAQTLESFLQIEKRDDQEGVLNDINDVLNDEVMADWRRLRKAWGNLADDSDQLQLELRFPVPDASGFEFQFKVTDRARQKKRNFDVVHRSKGFQWFFNFLMKLKFNPKYQDSQSDAIYLLDEPGSYLHSSAQDELLTELEQISHKNSILYCTHSQHLLDPEIINIGQTRIAVKHDGRISVIPFGSAGVRNIQGALSPLFEALQMRTGIFNRTVSRAVVTEGVIDFYFFRMLSDYLDEWKFDGVELIPGAGADQLKELISWCIAWTDGYRILLDSDEQGRSAKERYAQFFGFREAEHFVLYSMPDRSTNVKLENFLADVDKKRIRDATEVKNIKNAIIALHFSDDQTKKSVLTKLSSETKANLSHMQKCFAEV